MNTLQDVENLALELLATEFTITGRSGKIHNYVPHDLGYSFEFDNAKRRFGVCRYTRCIIGLSKPLCNENLDKVYTKIKDTLLHEIAHALTVELYGLSEGKGHGYLWVDVARQIGCKGQRCYDSSKVNLPQAKYTLVCPNCGKEARRHRKPRYSYSCSPCSGGRYDARFKLEVVQNY